MPSLLKEARYETKLTHSHCTHALCHTIMQVYGVIFVVDSGSANRLDEAKDEFAAIAQHDKIKGKPLLIFANKQDLVEVIDDGGAIAHCLDLDAVLGDNRVNSSVVRRLSW